MSDHQKNRRRQWLLNSITNRILYIVFFFEILQSYDTEFSGASL